MILTASFEQYGAVISKLSLKFLLKADLVGMEQPLLVAPNGNSDCFPKIYPTPYEIRFVLSQWQQYANADIAGK